MSKSITWTLTRITGGSGYGTRKTEELGTWTEKPGLIELTSVSILSRKSAISLLEMKDLVLDYGLAQPKYTLQSNEEKKPMAMNGNDVPSGGKFKKSPPLEAGGYPGRLVQIIGLGMQAQNPWKGEEKPDVDMIYTTYELSDEFLEDEDGNEIETKPRWVSERFALHSLDADLATSTKRYMALDQKMENDGDWRKMGGTPCIININKKLKAGDEKKKEKGRTYYNNIVGITPMRPKEIKRCVPLVNDVKVFDPEKPDLEVFFSLPDWLQEEIQGGVNFEGSKLAKAIKNYKPGSSSKKKDKKSGKKKGKGKKNK